MGSTPHDGPAQTTISEIPPTEPSFDADFRCMTALAHEADREGDHTAALGLYAKAADEADRLFDQALRGSGTAILIAPMAYTVAAHNLAVLHRRTGALREARTISVAATERLIAEAASAATPLALRLNCIRHLRHALCFLADIEDGRGDAAARAASLGERTRAVAADVIRVAELLRAAGPTPADRAVRLHATQSEPGASRPPAPVQ